MDNTTTKLIKNNCVTLKHPTYKLFQIVIFVMVRHIHHLIPIMILLFSQNILCQWKKGITNNKFDGDIKYASVHGTGGSWPNTKPLFTVNRFNKGEPNIYLTGVGYTCEDGRISIAFDGNDEIRSYYTTSDNAKEAVFITGSVQEISSLLETIKTKSKLYLRYSNSCGKDDYEFGLLGSQSAIDYVIGSYYENKMDEIQLAEVENRKRDSLLKVVRKERLERKKEEARLEAIRKSNEFEENRKEFLNAIPEMFNRSSKENFEHKVIATIKVTYNVKFNYCKKLYDSGLEVYDKEMSFYENRNYDIYNDIDGDCIKFVELSRNNKSIETVYLPISSIGRLADDYHLNAIIENWAEIKVLYNQ